MTNHLRTAIATFIMATAMTPAMVLAQSTYPVNFDENEASSHLLRHTNAVQLTSSYGTQTVEVNQKKEKRMYIKRLDDCLRNRYGWLRLERYVDVRIRIYRLRKGRQLRRLLRR